MFRPAFRAACAARAQPRARQIGRRFASTSSTKSGSWKGTALRWTAAAAVVYYYNTATFFAEEPPSYAPLETPHGSEQYETVDAIAEHRRAQARAQIHASQPQEKTESQQSEPVADGGQVAIDGPGALEEEAEQQGAFNEETGEINWDCPCLGGMAHGPCGEQFRAAFSCFVYSKVEPKGVDCIEQFKTMQNCFREHPDIYGAELDDVEVAEAQAEEDDGEASLAQTQASSSSRPASTDRESETQRVPESQQPSEPASETDAEVPKARHDGRSSVEE